MEASAGGEVAAVVCRGAGFAYRGGAAVLEGIDASLRWGRLTALLGPNASGKSTLLRMMLGQLDPGEGAVEVVGRPAGSWEARARARRVVYVPQQGSTAFGFSVREMVAMGRFAFGDEAFVEEAVGVFGLSELADRPMTQLSGGQQQRVLLSRAWVQSRGPARGDREPAVVLADEPTANLDLRYGLEAMQRLRAMADEGHAVLVVLHDLAWAERWADEVWLLSRGRMAAMGEPAEVLQPAVLSRVYGVELNVVSQGGRRLFYAEAAADGAAADTLTD